MTTDADKTFERAEALCLLAVEDAKYLDDYQAAHRAAQSLEHSGWKKRTNKMTQTQIILNHMEQAGSISAREAMLDHDMTSATLARRICDLEEQGHKIIRERKHNSITGKPYTRYTKETLV